MLRLSTWDYSVRYDSSCFRTRSVGWLSPPSSLPFAPVEGAPNKAFYSLSSLSLSLLILPLHRRVARQGRLSGPAITKLQNCAALERKKSLQGAQMVIELLLRNYIIEIIDHKDHRGEMCIASALSTEAHALFLSSSLPFLFFLNGFG